MPLEKFSHEVPHQREVRGVAGKLELPFLHCQKKRKARFGVQSRMNANWIRFLHGYGMPSSTKVDIRARKAMDSEQKRCSVSRMWKTLAAFILLTAPALAQERVTAYDALRVVGVHANRDAVNHIITVTGAKGDPQPETWRILLEDRGRGGIQEIVVKNGRVVSERPSTTTVGSAEGATIKTSRLNLDSSGAFQVASHIADKSGTRFDSASYTLRTDPRGEPVWIVTLHAVNGQPVGTIHIGANRGNVTRTEGMFAGATMQDVATEQRVYRERPHREHDDEEISDEEADDEHGPLYGVRQRMRGYFDRAQDEASGMFERVRRSFSDFMNR